MSKAVASVQPRLVNLVENVEHHEHHPNRQKVQKNGIYEDKKQHANFQGNPHNQATKWHLNNSQMVENKMQN